MHTRYLAALLLVGLLVTALPVAAEETGTANDSERARPTLLFPEARENALERRAEMKENSVERRHEIKENITARRAAFASSTALKRAELTENIKERVIARADHVIRLLNAMLDRLASLADRIQARIDLLDERGADTAAAKVELAEAEAAIEDAAEAVEAVGDGIEAALSSETPREALKEVKPVAERAKAAIRAAHQALMEAVRALPHAEPQAGETES